MLPFFTPGPQVRTYLALVGSAKAREEGRERVGSARERVGSARERAPATTTKETSKNGSSAQVSVLNSASNSSTKKPKSPEEKVKAAVVGVKEEAKVERERVGSVESGYGSGRVADMGGVMQTDL